MSKRGDVPEFDKWFDQYFLKQVDEPKKKIDDVPPTVVPDQPSTKIKTIEPDKKVETSTFSSVLTAIFATALLPSIHECILLRDYKELIFNVLGAAGVIFMASSLAWIVVSFLSASVKKIQTPGLRWVIYAAVILVFYSAWVFLASYLI